MKEHYTLQEYLMLDAFKKDRLFRENPEEYKRLESLRKANFNPETDHDALAELAANPSTRKLVSNE